MKREVEINSSIEIEELQQHLPFTVLKHNTSKGDDIFYLHLLQQHLPFTVLKRVSFKHTTSISD
ncbi:hypothetical protein [Veillonella parvula]|uniref:hypothetical protein n=1 Tax=Veillonella parvula TaxID=29466 RepID=UPI003C769DB7